MNQGDLYCVKWLGLLDLSYGAGYHFPVAYFTDEPIQQRREAIYRAWLMEKPMNEEGRELWEKLWKEANQQ